MKFLNNLKNLFAIVGVVSLIFWTCASDSVSNDSNDDSSLPPQITGGTYQVTAMPNSANLVVLNTENGVIKTYHFYEGQWTEGAYYSGVIGNGNLTVNH